MLDRDPVRLREQGGQPAPVGALVAVLSGEIGQVVGDIAGDVLRAGGMAGALGLVRSPELYGGSVMTA